MVKIKFKIFHTIPTQQLKLYKEMSMKRVLPLLTLGLLFLGACGMEKPPYKVEDESAKQEAPAEAAPAAAPAQEAAPADPQLAAGKTVYDTNCAGCHDGGIMGAPKTGDKAAWADRLAQGVDVMAKKSIEGFQGKTGNMPAKGGNTALTDAEVTSAVSYMADKSK
jgi:cytochrome c5